MFQSTHTDVCIELESFTKRYSLLLHLMVSDMSILFHSVLVAFFFFFFFTATDTPGPLCAPSSAPSSVHPTSQLILLPYSYSPVSGHSFSCQLLSYDVILPVSLEQLGEPLDATRETTGCQ